jgi:aryl-alcohol dehydrogenase-like predicted oxidoreductase
MRMSTDVDRDERLAQETIAAAVAEGITVFDTARAYARDEAELGHNERLVAASLKRAGGAASARIVTKGGMSRAGGSWVPDGRAKTILRDCEASLLALDGLPIDTFLIHVPDPRTPWNTSVRALARVADEGLARRVGLSNVNRLQLDEALEIAPIAAVEIALSLLDERAVRGGVVERCAELGIAVIAHSPLGGPRRASTLKRRGALTKAAAARGTSPFEVALAWLLELSPAIVAIPGATRPETARSAAHAARLHLQENERAALRHEFGWVSPPTEPQQTKPHTDTDVVLVMGIPGAGKTRVAESYASRGYVRLNRDERGGGLVELAGVLDQALKAGTPGVVLDNTYLARSSRSHVLETARRYGAAVRCIWMKTPLPQAQLNMVERILDAFGGLPTPDQLRARARTIPGLLTPTRQMRTFRELEPPSIDEGFSRLEVVEFKRAQASTSRPGVFVAASALRAAAWERALDALDPQLPHLVFDWIPEGDHNALQPLVDQLTTVVRGPLEAAVCPHPGGPPICWCRPPLPGLPLAFARSHGLDPGRCALIGTSAAHRTLANALGAKFVSAVTAELDA